MNTLTTKISGEIDASRRSAWRMRALAIEAAVVTNVIILIFGRVVNGELPMATVGSDNQRIGFAQVIVVTVLVGLVAWGLLVLLVRTTSRAVALWTVIAVIVFVVTLLGPIESGVNASSKAVLACMHVGAAATIIPLMPKSDAMRR